MSEHKFTTPPSMQSYAKGCRCDHCKKASSSYHRTWRQNNQTKAKAIQQRYRQRHPKRLQEARRKQDAKPQRKFKKRLRDRDRRLKNPDRALEYSRSRVSQVAAWMKAYKKTPRGRLTRQVAQKGAKARKRGAVGSTTTDQWLARWSYYGGLCYLCKQPASEMDHVIPISTGGSHWPSNLRPCCAPCNVRKSNRPWRLFIVA